MFAAALLLAACGTPQPASVAKGECKVMARAAAQVCGITVQDQAWIDEEIEGGVAACKFARPQPRTPTCQQLRDEIAAVRDKKPAPIPVPPKKGIRERVKGWIG